MLILKSLLRLFLILSCKLLKVIFWLLSRVQVTFITQGKSVKEAF